MDKDKELQEERAQRMRLEEDLAKWHEKAVDTVSPEVLASTVSAQQLRMLSYNLLKCNQKSAELQKRLREKEAELAKEKDKTRLLNDRLDTAHTELEYMKEHGAAGPEAEAGSGGVTLTDEELDSLLAEHTKKGRKKGKEKPRNTVRDFLKMLKRMKRIKLYDASLLLDVPQRELSKWAKGLEKRGYLRFEDASQKTVVATKKLDKSR